MNTSFRYLFSVVEPHVCHEFYRLSETRNSRLEDYQIVWEKIWMSERRGTGGYFNWTYSLSSIYSVDHIIWGGNIWIFICTVTEVNHHLMTFTSIGTYVLTQITDPLWHVSVKHFPAPRTTDSVFQQHVPSPILCSTVIPDYHCFFCIYCSTVATSIWAAANLPVSKRIHDRNPQVLLWFVTTNFDLWMSVLKIFESYLLSL